MLALALALLQPALAQQPDPDGVARQLFENGERLYDEGHYEQAIVAFQEAYALSGRPALLYNMANAYERLGRLEEAIEALNEFRIHASPEQQEVLFSRVAALQQRLLEERPVPVPLPRPEPLPMPVPVPVPVPQPVQRSLAPWVIAGLGGGMTVAGGAVAGSTWVTSRRYLQEHNHEQWGAIRTVNNVAFSSAVVGGTVAVGGLLWGLTAR
jgi:tetratricopeptide (TPR) repeat protein